MRYSRQQHLSAQFALLGVVLLTSISQHDTSRASASIFSHIWQSDVGKASALAFAKQTPEKIEFRIAKRLQSRLRNKGVQSPSIHALADAVLVRQDLLKKQLRIELLNHDGSPFHEWHVSTQRYPLWLTASFSLAEAKYELSVERIEQTLHEEITPLVLQPTNTEILEVLEKDDVVKVTANVARNGQRVPAKDIAAQIQTNMQQNITETHAYLEYAKATIVNATEKSLGDMTLLASGKSNFKGSTWSRSHNVRKALREHVNNTLVAPGETFSFNNTLEGPVSLGNGWAMAKIIVNGADLEEAPGGGICQASTTVYRAILNAGFPVQERKAHSLYVSYYKEYGVGIDATIYPGKQDLVFINDTDNYLLIQAYDDGYDAYVNIYGTPDGRTVDLQGPYFTVNAPDDLWVHGRRIQQNEVAWVQQVHYLDGRNEKNTIVSRYRVLPQYVRNEYAYAQ